MSKGKYGKYIVSHPIVEALTNHVSDPKGVTFPDEIYLDDRTVKGSPVVVDIGWRFRIPEPNPVERPHKHDFDEVLCFIGTNPDKPHDLGGEVEFTIGGEKHTFNTTTTIFVPAGTVHCPIFHRSVDRSFILAVFGLAPRYTSTMEDARKNPEKYRGS